MLALPANILLNLSLTSITLFQSFYHSHQEYFNSLLTSLPVSTLTLKTPSQITFLLKPSVTPISLNKNEDLHNPTRSFPFFGFIPFSSFTSNTPNHYHIWSLALLFLLAKIFFLKTVWYASLLPSYLLKAFLRHFLKLYSLLLSIPLPLSVYLYLIQ